jgi:membrane protease YdiL (CAAX protease family)
MVADPTRASYVVHYASGQQSDEMDRDAVRELIRQGHIHTDDKLSRNGSDPAEFYLFDEFVDLWDVEDHAYDDFYAPPSTPAASGEHAALSPYEPVSTRSSGEFAPVPTDGAPPLSADDVEQAMPAPVVGPESSAHRLSDLSEADIHAAVDGFFAPEDDQARPAHDTDEHEIVVDDDELPPLGDDDLFLIEVDDDLGEIAVETLPMPNAQTPAAAPQEPAVDASFAPETELPAAPETEPVELPAWAFSGFDPLADDALDPATILELLLDASVYTVLTISTDVPADQLQTAYLKRAELIAKRQRGLPRSDARQVRAMDDIRRLIYQAYQVLIDPESRQAYHQAASLAGRLPGAAEYLSFEPSVPASPSPVPVLPDSADRPAVPELPSVEQSGSRPGVLSARDLLAAELEEVTTTDSAEGVRLYSHVIDRLGEGSLDQGPVGELFEDTVKVSRPPVTRQSTGRVRQPTDRYRTYQQLRQFDEVPEGLRWGIDESPVPAVGQALGFTTLIATLSLIVVLGSQWGAEELNYARPSAWHWIRSALLIAAAFVGTIAVRRERASTLGFFPHIGGIGVGLAVGVAVGVLGAWVAPNQLGENLPFGAIAVVAIAAQAFAHEVFFRGFVTRILLVGFTKVFPAIVVSCLIYGAFYLSYLSVWQITGFWKIYYSVLLFGFGLGSIYAVLFWRTRSIWPGVVAHALVLFLTTMIPRI